MTNLTAALEAYKPNLIEGFSKMVRNVFGRMVEDHGPALKGIYNSERHARMWSVTVSRCAKRVGGDAVARLDTPYEISEEKLLVVAHAYAEAVVESWKNKIEGKMGELEAASVESLTGGTFLIFGNKGGKEVRIEQTTILKASTKGLLFNQFPARIYVNGKFTSEAAYKKMFA